MLNLNRIIHTKNLKTDLILGDILLPLDQRNGFTNTKSPIIPVYFYRYIGINKNSDEYYNDLYKLDKLLSNLNNQYLKFISNIPIPSNIDLVKKTNNLWHNLEPFTEKKKVFLLSTLKLIKAFPTFSNELLQNSIEKAFADIFDLYCLNAKNLNTTIIKNFTLKLIIWINNFIPNLFDGISYDQADKHPTYNPKIIYYGEIKNHEIYFLILLSKIGCDVLYINSNSACEKEFSNICNSNFSSNMFELETKSPLKEFPKKEILSLSRTETVAYKASAEIQELIYNEDDGLYKPWQFENYKVHPLTLKTTSDELKIIWNEEARFRDGFKIKNNVVYIPNMFAKISGVPEDLNAYWEDLSNLYLTPNTKLISQIPFTKINYVKNDLYKLVYLIDQNGHLKKEALVKNEFYKFSHLKTALQNTILNKMEELFELPVLIRKNDNELKIKIIMTILNLDKDILELLLHFDFPFKIPKLIIYTNDENIFSDEDSIVLAFLNLLGFDILIVTPTGYNNIENKIIEKYYDIHKLETINLNLESPNLNTINKKSSSIWSKFFKK